MEFEFLEWLRLRLPDYPCLRLGPGDDAAILRLGDGGECAVTVDLLSDGVDFRLAEVDPRRIGHKALAVNLSDLAAMAARPLACVIALALPRHGALALAKSLYEGLLPLAEQFDVAIAGGDLNCHDGPLVVSITAFGRVEGQTLRRDGAMPGDFLFVTGEFGGSILGKHLDFTPRVEQALQLAAAFKLHAGIDVSDGLSLDVFRMATSSGVGAALDLSAIPVAAAAHDWARQANDGRSALEHALSDGEDFELVLAVPPATAQLWLAKPPLTIPLTCIGRIVPERGLWRQESNGALSPLAVRGWEHGTNG